MHAPVIVIPCSSKAAYLKRYAQPDKGWTDEDEDRWPVPFWHIDTGMAALLILQTVTDAGLGACYFGVPPDVVAPVREAFGIPDTFDPIGADHHRPPHRHRRPPRLAEHAAAQAPRTTSSTEVTGASGTPPVHRPYAAAVNATAPPAGLGSETGASPSPAGSRSASMSRSGAARRCAKSTVQIWAFWVVDARPVVEHVVEPVRATTCGLALRRPTGLVVGQPDDLACRTRFRPLQPIGIVPEVDERRVRVAPAVGLEDRPGPGSVRTWPRQTS